MSQGCARCVVALAVGVAFVFLGTVVACLHLVEASAWPGLVAMLGLSSMRDGATLRVSRYDGTCQ